MAEETKNDVSTKSQFEIRGEKEAKQTLNFVFKHFEQGVNYEIDFGNGNKQKVTSPITHFSYAKAGKYRIVLKATYREQTKILYSDCVAVAEAVEILSGNKEVN